jgi:hypothetical protein
MVVLSDVLEHFNDIDDLFTMKWRYAFISYPETPKVETWEQLKGWRHFKPDEHIWCLNKEGMRRWMYDHGSTVIATSHFEDSIRKRWDDQIPNITSFLIERH